MPRIRNHQSPKPMLNPVAIIDLTQDSPSNTALRLPRIRTRRDELESDPDLSDNDNIVIPVDDPDLSDNDNIVIPVDDSTEDSDGVIEEPNPRRPNKTAILINLEDTVNIDGKPNEKSRAKKSVLNESPNKKGSLSCPICFENLGDENTTAMSTPCGHVYCLDCLKKVTQAKKKCALCQRSISLSKCIRLHI